MRSYASGNIPNAMVRPVEQIHAAEVFRMLAAVAAQCVRDGNHSRNGIPDGVRLGEASLPSEQIETRPH